MSARESNPYDPPTAYVKKSTTDLKQPTTLSFVACVMTHSFLECLLGGNALGQYIGTSPGDPFGRSQGSAIGGFIGLAVGVFLYAIVRRRFIRRAMFQQSESANQTLD